MAVANKASDVHLAVAMVPKLRVNGDLVEVTNFDAADDAVMAEMIMSMLNEKQKARLKSEKELDLSVVNGQTRFRANFFYQKGMEACSMRTVPYDIPDFVELKLPDIFSSFVDLKQGFVLVTGPTGHGKSTSVASVLNKINSKKSYHIVTIEDPVEYVIRPEKSIISQREVGTDTEGFGQALRSCLRQDPNVVFVGEMRDLETISSALTIAETGHLVFSTLHTNSASQAIDRIIDVFPEHSKDQIRVQLASVISAVVSQRLIPGVYGGRVPAFEIMTATPAVRNCIREGKTFMIDNIIQTSYDLGMISLEAYLAKLIKQGEISEENGMAYCTKPEDLHNRLRKTLKL